MSFALLLFACAPEVVEESPPEETGIPSYTQPDSMRRFDCGTLRGPDGAMVESQQRDGLGRLEQWRNAERDHTTITYEATTSWHPAVVVMDQASPIERRERTYHWEGDVGAFEERLSNPDGVDVLAHLGEEIWRRDHRLLSRRVYDLDLVEVETELWVYADEASWKVLSEVVEDEGGRRVAIWTWEGDVGTRTETLDGVPTDVRTTTFREDGEPLVEERHDAEGEWLQTTTWTYLDEGSWKPATVTVEDAAGVETSTYDWTECPPTPLPPPG